MLTKNQKHYMEHSVAGDFSGESYRNYYMCYKDSDCVEDLDGLVKQGMMTKRDCNVTENGIYYHVTTAGLEYMGGLGNG